VRLHRVLVVGVVGTRCGSRLRTEVRKPDVCVCVCRLYMTLWRALSHASPLIGGHPSYHSVQGVFFFTSFFVSVPI
jgi:hypothetical protein